MYDDEGQGTTMTSDEIQKWKSEFHDTEFHEIQVQAIMEVALQLAKLNELLKLKLATKTSTIAINK